jgi:hypothetical protein
VDDDGGPWEPATGWMWPALAGYFLAGVAAWGLIAALCSWVFGWPARLTP